MKERYYRPELDALRFFAFFTVFLNHSPFHSSRLAEIQDASFLKTHPPAAHLSGVAAIDVGSFAWQQSAFRSLKLGAIHDACGFGLCIFFLLSAYLIITILLREKDATGTVSLTSFAARRVLRIWPLYFLILTIAYVLGRYCPEVAISGQALLAFSLLLGNLYILSHGWILVTINPLWSLSVEEQFYLLIPGVMRYGGRKALLIIFGVALVLSYVVLIFLGNRHSIAHLGVWANSFVQFQFFAAGGLIAVALLRRTLSLSNVARLGLIAAGFIMWFIAAARFQLFSYKPSTAPQLVAGYLLLLSGTVAIFLSVLDLKVRIPKTLLYLGKISYGLYLFHQLFLWIVFDTGSALRPLVFLGNHIVIGALVALSATVAAASLSYRFFERPILLFKTRFEAIRTRAA